MYPKAAIYQPHDLLKVLSCWSGENVEARICTTSGVHVNPINRKVGRRTGDLLKCSSHPTSAPALCSLSPLEMQCSESSWIHHGACVLHAAREEKPPPLQPRQDGTMHTMAPSAQAVRWWRKSVGDTDCFVRSPSLTG